MGKFAPGQSGNLNGRPRKKVDLEASTSASPEATIDIDEIILRVAARPVALKRNGCTTEVPLAEALVQQTFAASMEDPRVALRLLQVLLDSRVRHSAETPTRTESDDNPLDDPIIQGAIEREVRRQLRLAGVSEGMAARSRAQDEVVDESATSPSHGVAGSDKKPC